MDKRQPIRVGFIGTGWAERVQVPMFRLAGLTAQAICARTPANAQRSAQQLKIPEVYDTWEALIAADTVDVVSIVSPPALHCEQAIAALQAGKHVICEKPTALNVAEAEAMLAAAQAAPNQLAIIDHELRFHPQRIHLRQLLKEGYVGSPLRINLSVQTGWRLNPTTPWGWWSAAEQGGGMVGAVGSHLFDLARWLVGKIDALTGQLQIGHYYRPDPATGQPRQVTADDAAHLLLHFANGVQGSLTVSGLVPGGAGGDLLIVGTKGALRLDPQEQLWGVQGEDLVKGHWQLIETGFPQSLPEGLPATQAFPVGTYFLGQVLAAHLSQGETVIPEAASFYDGLVVQRMLDAARQSHATQTWVAV